MTLQNASIQDHLADFQRFMGTEASHQSVIFLLVLGMTGAGKSTFIQNCTGKTISVGHGLQSCTNDLAVHSFFYMGKHIHLIDTPGFDDTNHSDIETLKTIAGYLSASYANGVRLSGIVYLHRISDNRLSGTGFRNLRMFRKLSGSKTWPNTIIGTTMWRSNEHAEGQLREGELTSDSRYFGDILVGGAGLDRIAEYGTGAVEQRQSSLSLVAKLLHRVQARPNIELKIQREMAVDGKTLDDTAAGKEALGDIYILRTQLASQIENACQDMQDALRAQDLQSAQQLQVFKKECAMKLSNAKRQQQDLKTSLLEIHDRETQKLCAKLDEMAAEQRVALEAKQRDLREMEDSLRLMREQSTIDEARWRKQRLDAQELERKRRAERETNRACEQDIAVLKQAVVRKQEDLGAVTRTRGTIRQNVVNGLANGATAGVATAVATLAMGLMCVVS